jgi:Xaa-Pro aminopeptidase
MRGRKPPSAAEPPYPLGMPPEGLAPPDDEAPIGPQLARRRDAVSALWDLTDELVLVAAGEPVPVPGRGDRTYPFRAHSEYFYLTDRERPGVLAFDPRAGWFDFVAPVTRDERLWEGAGPTEDGVPLPELPAWLDDRKGRRVFGLGAPIARSLVEAEEPGDVRRALNRVRREKDDLELGRMRAAQRATRAGFAAVPPLIAPGRTERELQIEIEAEFFRNGADFLAYETIVAGGSNSAVLHFSPTSRPLSDGELLLIDAGAEYRGYASDVTRTYPVSGRFTPEQAELYAIADSARERAIDCCRVGSEWRDVHRAAALVIAEGLAGFGLLRGRAESLVEQGAHSLFFPHGVGHMVGLGIRDAGEVLPGREPAAGELPRLRVDLPLLERYVVTVEPGIYLVPALLHDPSSRDRYRDVVDWDRVEGMLGFGGIRIEDDVLVTTDGPEILTKDIPHTL